MRAQKLCAFIAAFIFCDSLKDNPKNRRMLDWTVLLFTIQALVLLTEC